MSGERVWDEWCEGRIGGIRDYCETDVLNTWLVYLRFELIRGHLDAADYAAETARVRAWLQARPEAHWQAFAAIWTAS